MWAHVLYVVCNGVIVGEYGFRIRGPYWGDHRIYVGYLKLTMPLFETGAGNSLQKAHTYRIS